MSLLVLQEPTVTQNWDVWSRSRGQTMLSKNHTLHVAYLHPFSQIDNQICSSHHKNPLFFSIHFTFGPFLAFIRLWIECIILRPCIGTNWPLPISKSYLSNSGNIFGHTDPFQLSGAIQSLTFALYITKPFFPECDPPDEAVSSW